MDTATWLRVLAKFEAETGDAPSEQLEGWELSVLARLASKEAGERKRLAVEKTERLLLSCEGQSVEACHATLQRRFPPAPQLATEELRELQGLVAACASQADSSSVDVHNIRSRSRSPRSCTAHSQKLQHARGRLQAAMGASQPPYAAALTEVAARLLRAAYQTEIRDTVQSASRNAGLRAPACLGPPAFFPVGNTAGRHPPISQGMEGGDEAMQPRLLFVGLSDPRHMLAALQELPHAARPVFVANDLNAVTSARNALIMALLSHGEETAPRARRLLAAFCLWWSHELPKVLLPILVRCAAAQAAAVVGTARRCCSATSQVLRDWAAAWDTAALPATPQETQDLQEVLSALGRLDRYDLVDLITDALQGGCVDNVTLQHPAARLDYGLYHERSAPEGWNAAGDGVLLWPEPPTEEEFSTTNLGQAQPPRAEYVAALATLLPRFFDAVEPLAEHWLESGHLDCRFLAGDCLELPRTLAAVMEPPEPASASSATGSSSSRGFHRVYTSNVADHVGLPALAKSMGVLLEGGGRGMLSFSLSNNLRALDRQGDVASLIQKLHGASLNAVAAACGLTVVREEGSTRGADQERDLAALRSAGAEELPGAAAEALRTWPLECTRRLYRCPPPDPDAVAERLASGECLGMAHRHVRRFTVSPMTTSCIAWLLERASEVLPSDEAARVASDVKGAMGHSRLCLAQCLDWSRLSVAVHSTLGPEVRKPMQTQRVTVQVASDVIPGWAWRTHPRIALLWVRACGFRSAAAYLGEPLAPRAPTWHRCRKQSQLRFLEAGAWGPLGWALAASPDDVQVIDQLEVALSEDSQLQISFLLPEVEVVYAVGAAAFIVSLVDNVVVSGPHLPQQPEVNAVMPDAAQCPAMAVDVAGP